MPPRNRCRNRRGLVHLGYFGIRRRETKGNKFNLTFVFNLVVRNYVESFRPSGWLIRRRGDYMRFNYPGTRLRLPKALFTLLSMGSTRIGTVVCPNCSAAKDASLNLCSSVVGCFIEMLILIAARCRWEKNTLLKQDLAVLLTGRRHPSVGWAIDVVELTTYLLDYSNDYEPSSIYIERNWALPEYDFARFSILSIFSLHGGQVRLPKLRTTGIPLKASMIAPKVVGLAEEREISLSGYVTGINVVSRGKGSPSFKLPRAGCTWEALIPVSDSNAPAKRFQTSCTKESPQTLLMNWAFLGFCLICGAKSLWLVIR